MATSYRQVSTSQPCPVVLARKQAGQQADDAGDAAHAVDQRDADARRRAVGIAGQFHQSGLGLHQEIVARPVGALAGAAIGRDVQADDRGLQVLQARIVDGELGGLRAAQVVDHAVGALHQRLELAAALGRLDVERHALLAEVPGLEVLAVVRAELVRPDVARGIAVGRLDLDHLGAELGQEHRAVGAGAELLQRQDANARERLRRRSWAAHSSACRLIHCRAMMMRCISLVPSPMQVSGASR